jgi:hypothetical protein
MSLKFRYALPDVALRQFSKIKMVYLHFFVFVLLKLCYSNAGASRMWKSIFKRVAAERRVRIAGLAHSVIRTGLINITKRHFVHAVLFVCPMQEEK